MNELKKTCLHDKHLALGARMSPFAGFDMPIEYSGIVNEHNAVRKACGVFDVSHMGEIWASGPEAEAFVQYIFTNDIAGAEVGKIFYGMMLHPDGGTIDDLLVYKMKDDEFLLVVNAANIEKDYAWICEQAPAFNVSVRNESEGWSQLAVQGPLAETVVREVLGLPCEDLVFYTFKTLTSEGSLVILSRTGYTGEDGFEIYGTHDYIQATWDKLMADGRTLPCGLGARDTLRFEVGLPLYGDELTDELSPLEAGLGMFVKLDKEEFIGKHATALLKADGLKRKLVGIELADKAIPRHGYEVLSADGAVVGAVTTGYQSISTGKSVCMALVEIGSSKLDTPLQVKIHRKLHAGVVTKKRFYAKSYKK